MLHSPAAQMSMLASYRPSLYSGSSGALQHSRLTDTGIVQRRNTYRYQRVTTCFVSARLSTALGGGGGMPVKKEGAGVSPDGVTGIGDVIA